MNSNAAALNTRRVRLTLDRRDRRFEARRLRRAFLTAFFVDFLLVRFLPVFERLGVFFLFDAPAPFLRVDFLLPELMRARYQSNRRLS